MQVGIFLFIYYELPKKNKCVIHFYEFGQTYINQGVSAWYRVQQNIRYG